MDEREALDECTNEEGCPAELHLSGCPENAEKEARAYVESVRTWNPSMEEPQADQDNVAGLLEAALSLLDKEREKYETLWESSGKAITEMRERTSRLEEALREEHVRIHPNPKRWEPGLGPNVCDVCALIYWRETPGALESESRV